MTQLTRMSMMIEIKSCSACSGGNVEPYTKFQLFSLRRCTEKCVLMLDVNEICDFYKLPKFIKEAFLHLLMRGAS